MLHWQACHTDMQARAPGRVHHHPMAVDHDAPSTSVLYADCEMKASQDKRSYSALHISHSRLHLQGLPSVLTAHIYFLRGSKAVQTSLLVSVAFDLSTRLYTCSALSIG